jgi:cob(I)alamin adenosyltransferase
MKDSQFYTRGGDDGKTGLLGPERVPKHDLRPEAYGAVDEVQAALGLARAGDCSTRTSAILLKVQRDLHPLMAELASAGSDHSAFANSITAEHVSQLEGYVGEYEALVQIPKLFVVPGDSSQGAALHLGRTVARRAERRAVRLADEGLLDNHQVLRYLNRLSSLLFVLALYEDTQATSSSPTFAVENGA